MGVSLRVAELSPAWAAPAGAARRPPPQAGFRRVLNLAAALAGIVITLPLMGVIVVLIRLMSPGPAVYRQARIGLDRRARNRPTGNARRRVDYGGSVFTMYKFRTMYVAGTTATQVWAIPGDPRVTPVGRWLRRLRLDELPQLFNVLRGEMNVVGPRPEQPTIALRLQHTVDGYRARHCVLPGITGLAQTHLGYDASVEDVRRKVALDLMYISRASAWEDLKIMLRTFPVMVGRGGRQGR